MKASRDSILIVDDNPENLKLLQNLLVEHSFETRVAISGRMAITSVQLNPPGLILLDVRLPDLDGYSVAEILKNDENTADIPIIFISALKEPVDKVKAFATGGVDYITKPFAVDEVLARVNTHLKICFMQKQLKQVNEELEVRVQERTAELARINEELRQEIEQHQEMRRQIDQLNQELERKVEMRTAELVAANREMESFTYSVSHDLRAPLRTAAWYLDTIKYNQVVGSDVSEALKGIGQCIEKMNQLIDALLKFALALRQDQNISIFDLVPEINLIFTELAHAEPDRKVALVMHQMPPATGDPALIRQVLQNLLANAFKFTRNKDQAVIEVGNLDSRDAQENIYFVHDNGTGFDPRYQDRLFKVFQRLHGQQFEGIGVGLALCARLVERHGGGIWAESELGQGATFYFSLPV